jgi:hypothetical protein
MRKTRGPMTEAAREHLERKIYRLDATIQRGMVYEGVELDIAMEQARECRIGRAQARDVRQQLARDFRCF